jgi:hypothetical protein
LMIWIFGLLVVGVGLSKEVTSSRKKSSAANLDRVQPMLRIRIDGFVLRARFRIFVTLLSLY